MKICLNCMEEVGDSQEICPFCKCNIEKSLLPESNEIKPGEILKNRYIVGTVLDRRKSQILYIGKDIILQRIVQIVEYFPNEYLQRDGAFELILKAGVDGNTYSRMRTKFHEYYREIMLLYKEREVADIYSCFEYNNTCYAIEQYLKSNTYDSCINEQKPLEAVAALDLFGKAMRSVAKLHHEGLYHGNVKASSFIFGATADDVIAKDFYPRTNLNTGEAQLDDRRSLVNLFGYLVLGKTDVMEIDVKKIIKSEKTVLSNKIKQEILSMYESTSLDKSLDMIFRDIFDDSRTINQKPDAKTKQTVAKSSKLFKSRKSSTESKSGLKKILLVVLVLLIAIPAVFATGYFIGKKMNLFPKNNAKESAAIESTTKGSTAEKNNSTEQSKPKTTDKHNDNNTSTNVATTSNSGKSGR